MVASGVKSCHILQYEAKTGLATEWLQVATSGYGWLQTFSDIKRVVLFEFWQNDDICFDDEPFKEGIGRMKA